MLEFIFSENFLSNTILFSVPILFAGLAALISNKVGTLNINIEGSMSVSAMAGALASFYLQSFVLGLLVAIVVGIAMSMLLAFASLKLKTDSTLVGIALNTFATGVSIFVLFSVLGVKGDSSGSPSVMIPNLNIPFLSEIPIIGKAIFGQNMLVYICFACVFLMWFLIKKTRLGLRISAVGANPIACKAVGINVNKTKTLALIICGALAGLGGAFLSMTYMSYFSVGMVAGKGFIGLAAEAMGGGSPILTMVFAILFGAVNYFALGSQNVISVPYELLNTLPYLMTIIALILYAVKTKHKEIADMGKKEKKTAITEIKKENI